MFSCHSAESNVARARAIVRLNTSYFQAKALQSAVELGLFKLLADRPATVDEIRAKLELKHRFIKDFLDALVSLELLESEGGSYRNSALAAEYLVPNMPIYLGGTAVQHARMHYHAWASLTEALRDGKAKSAVAAQGPAAYAKYYEDLDRARQVMTHMDAHNSFTADELAGHIDWGRYRSFVDIGGARGNVAARLVLAHPHLHGGVFDVPALKPLYDELMQRLGTADRVQFHGGDFFADPLPPADVLILGHVLPDWPQDQRHELAEHAFNALPRGGSVVIYDPMIDESERDPAVLLQRINQTMLRDDASTYSISEGREYVEQAGFRFERVFAADTITSDYILIATKP
jgi:hypothetical protein